MGDVVELKHKALEFEGDARAKIDRLAARIAELWVAVQLTLEQFRSDDASIDTHLAHDRNVALRHEIAALKIELEDALERARFFDLVIDAADRDRSNLLDQSQRGGRFTLIAASVDRRRVIAMHVERRANRFFASQFDLIERLEEKHLLTA